MTKATKIWLVFALVLSAATTMMNAAYGRYLSVVIAVVALAGLSLLLFKEKKGGFCLMCACCVLSFLNGVFQGFTGETSLLVSILMSLIGASMIPGITYLFLRRQWSALR